MQSPIFSADTMFPVITPLGRSLRPGSAEPEIAPGCTVQKLSKPVHLIAIETRAGDRLLLSPESVFALEKRDGKVVLFNPPDLSFGCVLPPSWGQPITDPEHDYRVWFIIGAILSGGSYSADRNRPARLILRRENPSTAANVAGFIESLAARDQQARGLPAPLAVKSKVVADYAVISSRVIDVVVRPFISPKVHNLLFDPMALPRHLLHGFIAGLLSGMKRDAHGRAMFVHRNSGVILALRSALVDRLGVPVQLHVSLMEPTVQASKGVTDPHALVLYPNAIELCRRIGLTSGKARAEFPLGLRLDDVVRVEPAGRKPACIVVGQNDAPKSTANWFLFNPLFEIDPVITDFAADLMDPAQPEDEHPSTCRCEDCRFWGA